MDSDAASNPRDNQAPPVVNTPTLTFDYYGFSVDVYASEESNDLTGNQNMRIFYKPIAFLKLNEKKEKLIWSNKNSVRVIVELQKEEFNDLVRDHLKRHLQEDDETASLWIVTPLKINSLKASIVNANDSSEVNGIASFQCVSPHSGSMVFHFKCLNGTSGDIVKSIEDEEYAIKVTLTSSGFNQNQVLEFTDRTKTFIASPDTPNLSLLTTLKEEPQLYDLHTHLLGMGNAGFWIDTVLMNPKIMPTNKTFNEVEFVRRNFCPLIWYQDEGNKKFGFVDGEKATAFLNYLIKESDLPKKKKNDFDAVITNIQQMFPFSQLSSDKKLINDFKLNQELLHRKLCFKDDFSYDVVLKLDHLYEGLGIKKIDNHDLKQAAVAEKLGVYSSQSSVKFRNWIIFNAREQKFEIAYGIRAEDLRQLIHIDPNAPNEARRLARAHIINAFSMCDAEGTPARHVDLQSFHGNFTPQFYPRRFALKDSIYHQRLDVLAALIAHIVERYQSCLPPVKYCEFSVSVNDLSRAWMFDVLRSFPVGDDVILSTTQDDFVQAKMKFSSFSQMVCKKHFTYLRVAFKACDNEENTFRCKYEVNYKFLAGFSRDKVKSQHFKTQDEALRLLSDSPQVAILLMRRQIRHSLNMNQGNLRTEDVFDPFLEQLEKLKEMGKKRCSFYGWVVGLDLFGDELGYPYCPFVARPFIEYINRRREYNERFGLRIHGGENVIFADDNSPAYRLFIAHMYIVFISLQFLQRELKSSIRIGHGIAFERILGQSMSRSRHRKSSVLLADMERKALSLFQNIAFEVNITSNEYLLGQTLRQGDFARTLRLNALLNRRVPIILATDDDGIWPIDQCSFVHPGHQSLAAEYCRAILSSLIRKKEHLNDILESARTFSFWDPALNTSDAPPDNDDNNKPDPDHDDNPDPGHDNKPDPDHDDYMVNPIIVDSNIINHIYKRYDNPNVTQKDFRKRWQQLPTGEPEDLEWENEAMQHVAFICICGNSKEDDANRNLIYEEYKQLFDPHDYFEFIYKNWENIRNEFMSFDGYKNSSTLSHRVFIEKPSSHPSANNQDVQVTIHAFGPNMINNENVEELECFTQSYPDHIKNMSLVIYTNNDKNKYHYHETSESLKIEVNPNPSKRETQRENFLYALCEHASAATAALHCISDHVARYMASAEHDTNDEEHNVLDVFDSDMTSQTLLDYGFRNESTINSKLKGLLCNIFNPNDLSKLQKSNPERSTEKELIEALRDHRLAFRTLNLALKYVEEQSARYVGNAAQDNMILTTLCVILNGIGQEGAAHPANVLTVTKLTELNLSKLIRDKGTNHLIDALKDNKTLKKLQLGPVQIEEQEAKDLAAVLTTTTLTTLCIILTRIGGEGTAHLANVLTATKLTELNLSKLIKDEGTKHLADALKNNTTLKKLHLGWDEIEDQEAKDLAAVLKTTQIVELDLRHNEIGDNGAQHLANALEDVNTMLEKLDLAGNQIGDEGAKHLADALEKNKKLTTLNLSRNEIGDKGAKQLGDALQNNGTLTQLHLYKNRIRDKGVEHLANALKSQTTKLTELHLGWNLIRDEGAKHLADALENNEVLTKLDIGGNQIRDKGANNLIDVLRQRTTKFREFGFGVNLIGDKVEYTLRNALQNIQVPDLPRDQSEGQGIASDSNGSQNSELLKPINDAQKEIRKQWRNALVTILNTSTPSELDLTGQIGDQEIQPIAEALENNQTLEKLHLGWNQILHDGTKHLASVLKTTKIVELYLRHNAIGDKGAHYLAKALENGETMLEKLDLSGNQIGDEGTKDFADALKKNTKLIILNLSRNEIGDEGAEQLGDALQNNGTLTQLHLYKNRIRDKGVEHLANALKGQKTKLTELHLGWNLIHDEGAKHLADALENNTILTKLDIGGNQIGEKGARNLASALKDNRKLIELDLSGNEIGDKGANDLAEKLNGENLGASETRNDGETDLGVSSKNWKTQLKELYLGWNQVGDKGIQHFANVLRKNKEWITLHRSGNQIGEAAEKKLANALTSRP